MPSLVVYQVWVGLVMETKRGPPIVGLPLKNANGAAAGGSTRGTYKSGVGTDKAIHAILSSSLTQVLQLFTASSCPRRPHYAYQLSDCNYFSIPYFFNQHFRCFWFILPQVFQLIFFIPGRMDKFLPSQSVLYRHRITRHGGTRSVAEYESLSRSR